MQLVLDSPRLNGIPDLLQTAAVHSPQCMHSAPSRTCPHLHHQQQHHHHTMPTPQHSHVTASAPGSSSNPALYLHMHAAWRKPTTQQSDAPAPTLLGPQIALQHRLLLNTCPRDVPASSLVPYVPCPQPRPTTQLASSAARCRLRPGSSAAPPSAAWGCRCRSCSCLQVVLHCC